MGKTPHHVRTDAGPLRPEWSWRQDDAARGECRHLYQVDPVGPAHDARRAQSLDRLHQVPCEGIVVIQDQNVGHLKSTPTGSGATRYSVRGFEWKENRASSNECNTSSASRIPSKGSIATGTLFSNLFGSRRSIPAC